MSGKTILIVNSGLLVTVGMAVVLEKEGYKCEPVRTISDARLLVQNAHLVVVDLDLPEVELEPFLKECLPNGNYVGTTERDFSDLPSYYKGGEVVFRPYDPQALIDSVNLKIGQLLDPQGGVRDLEIIL